MAVGAAVLLLLLLLLGVILLLLLEEEAVVAVLRERRALDMKIESNYFSPTKCKNSRKLIIKWEIHTCLEA